MRLLLIMWKFDDTSMGACLVTVIEQMERITSSTCRATLNQLNSQSRYAGKSGISKALSD